MMCPRRQLAATEAPNTNTRGAAKSPASGPDLAGRGGFRRACGRFAGAELPFPLKIEIAQGQWHC